MTQINQTPVNISQNQTKNYPRADYSGALTTASMGGVAWGVAEYLFRKKPFYDSETKTLKDTFVNSLKEGLEGIKDPKIFKLKNLEVSIDKISTKEELTNFFENNKKILTNIKDDALNALEKNLKEQDVESGKNVLKILFNKEKTIKQYVHEIFELSYDKAGKLVHDAQKVSKEKFDIIKNTADKFRKNNALKAAVSFAVISAAIMCIFEYFKGRKAKKMAKQELQQQM